MPQSFKTDADNTMSNSYTYESYEREKRHDMLLSYSTTKGLGHSTYEASSSTETKPILDKNANSTKGSQSKHMQVLVLLACIYLHVAAFGLVVAFGVIYVELIDAFNALRADVALIQSIYMGATLAGGVFFTKILERYNPGKCVVISALIGTTALVGSAFGTNVVTLIILIGLILGIVMSCIILATFVTITNTFTTNRKFALAILTFGATIGQIVIPFITYGLIEEYYWNGALLILSSLTVLNCVPCGLLIMASTNMTMGNKTTKTSAPKTITLFKDPLFHFYIVMYLVFLTFGPVEQWFSADLAVLKGFSFQEGSTLLSVNGGAGLGGRFIGTFFLKMFKDVRPEIYQIAGFPTWTIAHYTVYIAPEYWLMVLAMVLRGLSVGLVVSTIASMQLELNGVEHFATTVAVCNFVGGAGEIAGGYIGGYTVDVTGSYEVIFMISAGSSAFSALSMVVIYFVLSRRRKQTSRVSYKEVEEQ